jgi:hypothetical protein
MSYSAISIISLLIILIVPVTVRAAAVDESAVIIPACRMKNSIKNGVVDASSARATFKNCIQGVIQFIIVLAALGTILKLAFTGINLLDPTSNSEPETHKLISNLVIGFFLLLVGWNLVPIMNVSMGNATFMTLPAVGERNTKPVEF